LEQLTIGLLIFDVVFWALALRYYTSLSIEIFQYAESSLRSPLIRSLVFGIYGFGITILALLSANLNATPVLGLFSIFSPLLSYGLVYFFLVGETAMTLLDLVIAFGCAVLVFLPFGYVLYKTRKELETRFQFATMGELPKKQLDGLKISGVSHGRPAMRGLVGAISGVLVFPWYLYFHLFRASQGVVVYRKLERANNQRAWADREKLLIVDAEQALAAADEATMPLLDTPLCPKCKRQLVYLEDQQKFWCKKCKRAAYVG